MSAICSPFTLPRDRPTLNRRLSARRAPLPFDELQRIIELFQRVFEHGEGAVLSATRDYDGVALTRLDVPMDQVAEQVRVLPAELRQSIDVALSHIREVNLGLLPADTEREVRSGTRVGEGYRPLASAAVYVPTRKGPLISTALMLIGAARAAGVERIAMLAPPLAAGGWEPRTFAAGLIAGATEFYVGNGVALIAALCTGTEHIASVDGIFGPGPAGIAAAMGIAGCLGKRTALGLGPTDCAVLADASANPVRVALDLMAEAEHGKDSCALLVTPSGELASAVGLELARRIPRAAPGRREILEGSFGPRGLSALAVAPWAEGLELIDDFAPEHLMLVGAEAEALAPRIRNAGELLIGQDTPFAAANYAIGVSAVLPTNGYARSSSALTARDFLRLRTSARLEPAALEALIPTIVSLATAEGLTCHAASVAER